MAMTEEKAERIAQEYAKIDYKGKIAPLIAVGYSPNYARALGLKLYDNVVVKAAINRIKAVTSEKIGLTVKFIVDKLKMLAEDNEKTNPSVSIKAYELLGKHKGIFEIDNKQKAGEVRKYDIKELKMLIIGADDKDKMIADTGLSIAGEG